MCFNCSGNDESRWLIDSAGGCDVWRAMVAAMPSIVLENWGGGWWNVMDGRDGAALPY